MNANKERGEVPFVSGGKSYVLKMTSNAMCELESVSGRTLQEIATAIADPDTRRMTDVRLFLWAMLRHHHPELAVEHVGPLIDDAGMEIGTQLQNLVALNMKEAPKRKNPRKAQAGIGASSTLKPVRSA